jgi:hypothetical protein
VDGNYGVVRDRLWPKANLIVWLNYSLPLVFWRGLTRTLSRSNRFAAALLEFRHPRQPAAWLDALPKRA